MKRTPQAPHSDPSRHSDCKNMSAWSLRRRLATCSAGKPSRTNSCKDLVSVDRAAKSGGKQNQETSDRYGKRWVFEATMTRIAKKLFCTPDLARTGASYQKTGYVSNNQMAADNRMINHRMEWGEGIGDVCAQCGLALSALSGRDTNHDTHRRMQVHHNTYQDFLRKGSPCRR